MEADAGRIGFKQIGCGGGYIIERTTCLGGSPSEAQCRLPISDGPFRHQPTVVPCAPILACDMSLPLNCLVVLESICSAAVLWTDGQRLEMQPLFAVASMSENAMSVCSPQLLVRLYTFADSLLISGLCSCEIRRLLLPPFLLSLCRWIQVFRREECAALQVFLLICGTSVNWFQVRVGKGTLWTFSNFEYSQVRVGKRYFVQDRVGKGTIVNISEV